MKYMIDSILEPVIAVAFLGLIAFGIVAVVSLDAAKRLRCWIKKKTPTQWAIWFVGAAVVVSYLLRQ